LWGREAVGDVGRARGVNGAAHSVQMRRTRRWARMALDGGGDEEGLDAMSSRRVVAPAASLVWSVLKTRVAGEGGLHGGFGRFSLSRISPIMTTVGIVAEDRAQGPMRSRGPTLWLTWIWLTPGTWYSTGSSTVMALISSETMRLREAVEGRRFARAGGAGDQQGCRWGWGDQTVPGFDDLARACPDRAGP